MLKEQANVLNRRIKRLEWRLVRLHDYEEIIIVQRTLSILYLKLEMNENRRRGFLSKDKKVMQELKVPSKN